MSTLDDKLARSVEARCPHCKGELFRLLGKAPDGTRINEELPTGDHLFDVAECDGCGETYSFTIPFSLRLRPK